MLDYSKDIPYIIGEHDMYLFLKDREWRKRHKQKVVDAIIREANDFQNFQGKKLVVTLTLSGRTEVGIAPANIGESKSRTGFVSVTSAPSDATFSGSLSGAPTDKPLIVGFIGMENPEEKSIQGGTRALIIPIKHFLVHPDHVGNQIGRNLLAGILEEHLAVIANSNDPSTMLGARFEGPQIQEMLFERLGFGRVWREREERHLSVLDVADARERGIRAIELADERAAARVRTGGGASACDAGGPSVQRPTGGNGVHAPPFVP